nr:MFS transporter [Limobrevibacterium gyesilva]
MAPVTLTLCLGEGVYAFNSFLVSTAMPSAVRELGGIHFIGWTATLYLVAAIVTGSAAGFLKQRFGARPLLSAAALVFLAGTVAAGGAPSMAVVLVGRTLQGAGEGAIAAACYALVAELYPQRMVPKAFGLLAVVWALAAFGGPALAGALTEAVSWRAAFLVNIPVIAVFLVLVPRALPATSSRAGTGPPSGKSVPMGRLAGIAGGIMLIAVASVAGPAWLAAALVGLGFLTLAAVFAADRRAPGRLFPGDAFAVRTVVGAGLWVVFLMPLGQATTSVYLPISVQSLWGYTPTAAGALVAVMALSWSGTAVLTANFTEARARRLFIRLGPVLLAAGLAGTAVALPAEWPVLLVPCQVLIGSGFGVGWGFLNQAITEAAQPGEADRAAGLVPTTQSAGYAIGAAIAGCVANLTGYADALMAPGGVPLDAWIFTIGALFAAAAAVISLRAGLVGGGAQNNDSYQRPFFMAAGMGPYRMTAVNPGATFTQQLAAVKLRPSTPHVHNNEAQSGGTRPVIRATLDWRRGNGGVDGSRVRRVRQADHGQRHRHPHGLSVRQRDRRAHRCRAGARGHGQPGNREPDTRGFAPLGR